MPPTECARGSTPAPSISTPWSPATGLGIRWLRRTGTVRIVPKSGSSGSGTGANGSGGSWWRDTACGPESIRACRPTTFESPPKRVPRSRPRNSGAPDPERHRRWSARQAKIRFQQSALVRSPPAPAEPRRDPFRRRSGYRGRRYRGRPDLPGNGFSPGIAYDLRSKMRLADSPQQTPRGLHSYRASSGEPARRRFPDRKQFARGAAGLLESIPKSTRRNRLR